jgi:hypothetical protein
MSPRHLEITAAAALSRMMAKSHDASANRHASASEDEKIVQHGPTTDEVDASSEHSEGVTTAVPPSPARSPDHSMGGPEKA